MTHPTHIKRVILDLDYTLLDMAAFKGAMARAVADLGISKELFWKTYEETVRTIPGQYDYDVQRHAALLKHHVTVPPATIVDRIGGVLADTPAYLYPDAIPFLEFLQHRGIAATLLTLGNKSWQQKKVERLGLQNLITDVRFTDIEKEGVALSFPEPEATWMFIDDHPGELAIFQKRYPQAQLVRIRRAEGKTFPHDQEQIDVPAYPSLSSLQGILNTQNAS